MKSSKPRLFKNGVWQNYTLFFILSFMIQKYGSQWENHEQGSEESFQLAYMERFPDERPETIRNFTHCTYIIGTARYLFGTENMMSYVIVW